ncbi:MAG TPA: sulfur carrier protein ThiS [Solirubrobacteraceae bacterium]|nr:sulfur carrier protein ThiS [Solirubrobacteraceae bacterium]
MRLTVNGQERMLPEGATVQSLVSELGAPESGRGVAVAVDGEVVPRSRWSESPLRAGARVEVLTAVQGG